MATTSSHIDTLGFGLYQHLLVAACGLASVAESMEMGASAPLTAAFGTAFGLSPTKRAELVAVSHIGESVGTLAAGLLCDVLGRKGMLLWSSAASALVLPAIVVMPLWCGVTGLMCLRFLSGVALGMMVVSTIVLAVESCSAASRNAVVFSIQFISYTGYLLSAVNLSHYMPGFGEAPSDSWRAFCLVMSVPFVLSVICIAFLVESPLFSAVRGDSAALADSLRYIAKLNGCQESARANQVQVPRRKSVQGKETFLARVGHGVKKALIEISMFPGLLALLVTIECCRTFFTAGIVYASKDIFLTVSTEAMPATTLNIIASFAPFVGILVASAVLSFGLRFIMLAGGLLGAGCAWALATPAVRGSPGVVLALVLLAKFTFSPLLTCVKVMKAEAFPTEVRGSMMATMHFLAKFACMLAPTLEELLRGRGASAWQDGGLDAYLRTLGVAVLLCGLLALAVPRAAGSGGSLTDFVAAGPASTEEAPSDSNSQGSDENEAFNIWEQASMRKSTTYGAAPS